MADPAEDLFFNFIAGYTAENVRDAITLDIDLGKLVVDELGADYIQWARDGAKLYDLTHPGARAILNDPMESALRVLDRLKQKRPDIGYEIETYSSLRTGTAMGLVMASGQSQAEPVQQFQENQENVHVGLSWLGRNIISLAGILL